MLWAVRPSTLARCAGMGPHVMAPLLSSQMQGTRSPCHDCSVSPLHCLSPFPFSRSTDRLAHTQYPTPPPTALATSAPPPRRWQSSAPAPPQRGSAWRPAPAAPLGGWVGGWVAVWAAVWVAVWVGVLSTPLQISLPLTRLVCVWFVVRVVGAGAHQAPTPQEFMRSCLTRIYLPPQSVHHPRQALPLSGWLRHCGHPLCRRRHQHQHRRCGHNAPNHHSGQCLLRHWRHHHQCSCTDNWRHGGCGHLSPCGRVFSTLLGGLAWLYLWGAWLPASPAPPQQAPVLLRDVHTCCPTAALLTHPGALCLPPSCRLRVRGQLLGVGHGRW